MVTKRAPSSTTRSKVAGPLPSASPPPEDSPTSEDRLLFAIDSFVPKNRRHTAVTQRVGRRVIPRIVTSAVYKKWLKMVAAEVQRLGLPKLSAGRWRLTVWTTWPTLRHLDECVPMGDSDASISPAKDALQAAGVLDDDMRIVEDHTYNLYEKGVRRIVVLLERTDHNPMATPVLCRALVEELAVRRSPEALPDRPRRKVV